MNSFLADLITEVFHASFDEFTFVHSPVQSCLPQSSECHAKMFPMFLHRFAEDENVVEINKYKLVYLGREDLVHKPLECGRGITKPKQHYKKLPLT